MTRPRIDPGQTIGTRDQELVKAMLLRKVGARRFAGSDDVDDVPDPDDPYSFDYGPPREDNWTWTTKVVAGDDAGDAQAKAAAKYPGWTPSKAEYWGRGTWLVTLHGNPPSAEPFGESDQGHTH